MNAKPLPSCYLSFLGHFLRSYGSIALLFVFLSFLAGLWGPVNNILIKIIIDSLPSAQTKPSILFLPLSFVVLNFIALDNITWRGVNYIQARYIPQVIESIGRATTHYVLGHSPHYFQDNLSGKVAKQISTLMEGSELIISTISPNLVRGASLLLTALMTCYFVNPIFFVVMLGWFLLFFFVSFLMSKKLVFLSDKLAKETSILSGEIVDTIANHHNVRLFSRKSFEGKRLRPYFSRSKNASSQSLYYECWVYGFQGGSIALMLAFTSYCLLYLYGKSLVGMGDFALILGLSVETGHMIWFTIFQVIEFNKAFGKCKHSLSYLLGPLDIVDKPGAERLKILEGSIYFEKVCFHYPSTGVLFQDLNVRINPGEKVGLVGFSGSGKSTFINVLLRLYEIERGHVYIDGQDIAEVTQDSLHEGIGVIPQNPILFQRSLIENLRYGRLEASDKQVIEAAKEAHAHDFIEKLSEGYESMVGERGIKLSGGQCQRIAIARAMLKNAPILILDEATSQLDSIAEQKIQDSLWKLIHGKTTLIIAHRLSTLMRMDRILVFHKGKIVEEGTHKDLLEKKGQYKILWEAQVGGFIGK